ncbi:hypothetical protein MLD38_010467 [Melastoma candidum]|uniref:Uncharacterized protein n=1 Tax=Melastoma candidum TaxID=119954 RepID=A0ACB9R107_9MYRT|nr:hypothetical protein MLD38_010467 [Melastoma candidum]
MGSPPEISKVQVITKLKDDGDFDRLRLNIIRKLKDNEELRNKIGSTVKQSAALSRPGAENMRPRQLSDAIHEDVGAQVMALISDNLWEIIRSDDGMKNEIVATVQSVYDKLKNPSGEGIKESSLPDKGSSQMVQDSSSCAVLNGDADLASHEEGRAPEQIGSHRKASSVHGRHSVDLPTTIVPGKGSSEVPVDKCAIHSEAPPRFSSPVESVKVSECVDDDPDLPPGFS